MKFLQTTCRSPTSNAELDHSRYACTAFPTLHTRGVTYFPNLHLLVIAQSLHLCAGMHLLLFLQTARIKQRHSQLMPTRCTKNLVAIQMLSSLVTTGVHQLRMVPQFLNRSGGKLLWECQFHHGAQWEMRFITNLDQIQRSWYMFFFQHGLSDFVVGANNLAFIDMLWDQWSPGFSAPQDLANAKATIATPEHLAAALGYYRAALGTGFRDPALSEAQSLLQGETPPQPLLYLHGATRRLHWHRSCTRCCNSSTSECAS